MERRTCCDHKEEEGEGVEEKGHGWGGTGCRKGSCERRQIVGSAARWLRGVSKGYDALNYGVFACDKCYGRRRVAEEDSVAFVMPGLSSNRSSGIQAETARASSFTQKK